MSNFTEPIQFEMQYHAGYTADGANYELKVEGQTAWIYKGGLFEEPMVQDFQLSERQYEQLLGLLKQLFQHKSHDKIEATDCGSYEFQLKSFNDSVKKLYHYEGDKSAPESLLQIEQALEALFGLQTTE